MNSNLHSLCQMRGENITEVDNTWIMLIIINPLIGLGRLNYQRSYQTQCGKQLQHNRMEYLDVMYMIKYLKTTLIILPLTQI